MLRYVKTYLYFMKRRHVCVCVCVRVRVRARARARVRVCCLCSWDFFKVEMQYNTSMKKANCIFRKYI